MNNPSRPAQHLRRQSASNMTSKPNSEAANNGGRKEPSQRRSRSMDTSAGATTKNEMTPVVMDQSDMLQRMSGGMDKDAMWNNRQRRSISMPGTAKEETIATTKKPSSKSSRDLKKHKSSRRHSNATESSTRSGKKHRKSRSGGTAAISDDAPLSRESSTRSSKKHRHRSKDRSSQPTENASPKSDGDTPASKKQRKPRRPSKATEDAVEEKPRSVKSAEQQSTLDRDLAKKARKSRRNMQEGDNSKSNSAKKRLSDVKEENETVENAKTPPTKKGSGRSVSRDPSTRRSRKERPSLGDSSRNKSLDGGDRRRSSGDGRRPKKDLVAARTVDAATAKEISGRREAFVTQQEDDWIVKSVGGQIQLEVVADHIAAIDDGRIEDFDANRSVQEDPINFLEDDPKDMTYGRQIALKLMKYKWYNPKADTVPMAGSKEMDDEDKEKTKQSKEAARELEEGHVRQERPSIVTKLQFPSLAQAWAYFEHVALPRYMVEPKSDSPTKNTFVRMIRKCFCKASKKLDRAEPGENLFPTKLYSPIFTPLSQMGDFGLGIGLYFSTLRGIMIMMLLAGLINIPNFLYFAGDAYSMGQPGVDLLLKGSAICTNQVWVPCPNCTRGDFEDNLDRLATTERVVDDKSITLTFALLNNCDGATFQQGMVNYVTLIFVLLGIVAMNIYQKHMEVKYDEDEQTAQDYSIVITNPPPDANNPEEWRLFFRYNFEGLHTTACTIAVDNDLLVRTLTKRRECIRKIEMLVEPGTSLDNINLAQIAMEIERKRTCLGKLFAMIVPGVPELYGQVTVLTAKIQGLAQQDYPVSHVFLTFETEAAQRAVLSALSVGTRATDKNNIEVMKDHPTYLFRGTTVLAVEEPDEPSTVRWQDLNAKFFAKLNQLLMTTLATIAAIAVIALLIWKLHGVSPLAAAIAIAAANSIFPQLAKLMTMTESHASECGKQTSLYFKIAFFRWVNTAIIITIITPFTKTLDDEDGLIRSIGAIFFADIVTTNAIQLLDPIGHLQRHFLAPRAATQDLMNLNMRGVEFELAERYTNMTKILFLALWYCSIYPGALFLCSFALLINFFMDRFSLMRTWKRAPALGTTISKFSRKYFFSTAVIAMAVVSSYQWAEFRFDNLCEANTELDPSYYSPDGPWTITTSGSGKTYSTSVNILSEPFKYCFQDMFRQSSKSFPAIPTNQPEGSEWMTEEQVQVTKIYGWSSVGVLIIVFLSIIWGWIDWAKGLFKSTYEPSGEDQGINFSEVPSISTYVPQVESRSYAYPLLACNVDGIDEDLFDWTPPDDRTYSFYDLTKDAEEVLQGTDISTKMVFSKLSHWPPEGKKRRGSWR